MTYHLLEWSQEHCPDPQKRWTPGTSEVAPKQYKTSCLWVRKSRSPGRLYQQTTDISAVGNPSNNGQGRGNDTANTSNLESWDSNRVLTIVGIFFVVKRHVARGQCCCGTTSVWSTADAATRMSSALITPTLLVLDSGRLVSVQRSWQSWIISTVT